MAPEAKARKVIDRQLNQAGWDVQNYRQMNISAASGVAIREFPLKTGDADYLLYADGKAIGVVEAKPEGFTLRGVELQSSKYTQGLPANLPHYRLPLPFGYETTGAVTQFTNSREPDARSREVFTFHRPEVLIRLVKLDMQVRTHLREMPPLNVGHLWRVQIESINNLETSLAANRPRALIQMATGSGKTFTAVNFCYRLIKYAEARRIFFLVDRNNLGNLQVVHDCAARHGQPQHPLGGVGATGRSEFAGFATVDARGHRVAVDRHQQRVPLARLDRHGESCPEQMG